MEQIIQTTEQKLNSVIELLNEKLSFIIATGANPLMLKNIQVKYYETMTPLVQMANIKSLNPSMLIVIPFDKEMIKDIIESIHKSNSGLNPVEEGDSIKIIIPPMTSDKREIFAKEAKRIVEESRIQVRNIRTNSNKKIKSLNLSENEDRFAEEKIQKFVDLKNKDIEQIIKIKIKSLLSL